MPVRCRLADYHGSNVSIKEWINLLYRLWERNPSLYRSLRTKGYTKEKEYLQNMSGIGFTSGQNLTPRGLSFLVCSLLSNDNTISVETSQSMFRFVLLRAIVDLDWMCSSALIYQKYVLNKSLDDIKRELYPYDTKQNFQHRYRFHIKVVKEIGLLDILNIFGTQFSKSILDTLLPYNSFFPAQRFFNIQIKIPLKEDVFMSIMQSLEKYKLFFKKHLPFGYSEVLKTMVQAILLDRHFYIYEPDLCADIITKLSSSRISFYRSSKQLRLVGRGIYRQTRTGYISFTYFGTQ